MRTEFQTAIIVDMKRKLGSLNARSVEKNTSLMSLEDAQLRFVENLIKVVTALSVINLMKSHSMQSITDVFHNARQDTNQSMEKLANKFAMMERCKTVNYVNHA